MATRKGGSLKKTDTVLITSVTLSTEVTGTLGVANGGTGQSTFTDGQLLIGNTTGNTLTKATLTQGTGVTITNSAGSITIAAALAVSDIPALNGFTGATPALDDIVPFYDTSATANRDATIAEVVGAGVEGFIHGCKLEYVDTNTIRVTPGLAYIQSSGKILRLAANDDTDPSLSSSTWYHVYLYDNSGTVDTEISTTAPDTPWIGTAKSKTGDPSRRYLGSFRTNSSSEIFNFRTIGSGNCVDVAYLLVPGTQMRMLSSGTAEVNTNVSCSSGVPTGTRLALMRVFSNGNQALRTDSDDMTGTDPDSGQGYIAFTSAGGDQNVYHPLNSSQNMRYSFFGTRTSGGLFLDVLGYKLER